MMTSSPPGILPWTPSNSRTAAAARASSVSFRNPGIAGRDFQRIVAQVDELDPERETALIDQAARTVERDIIRLAAHGIGQTVGKFLG